MKIYYNSILVMQKASNAYINIGMVRDTIVPQDLFTLFFIVFVEDISIKKKMKKKTMQCLLFQHAKSNTTLKKISITVTIQKSQSGVYLMNLKYN